jgi:hypothetical protein
MEEQMEFKFPDEQATEAVPEIEIVDDTPPEDRNREPLPKEVLEKAVEDPLDEYSDKVKSRINQLRKGVHDIRREKETAIREREEAIAFAQRLFSEKEQLKQRINQGEKVFISEVTKAATTEISAAKEALKRAYESGDPDKITEAQELLTDAKLKLRDYQKFKPSLQNEETRVQQPQQAQPAPRVQPDPKAESWRQKNTWFGADEEMTALALGLHEKLVRSGVDPRSDDYYRQVDTTMKKRFPEYFGEEPTQTRETPRKTTTVVAPATRSTAPRQVRLTASEAAIAKRLGLSPEAYAREKMKLENN